MSKNIYQPYTYLVGWSKLKKYYYGVKYGKCANPENFWVTYYTSSKQIPIFRKLYGEPDIIQVRKIFKTKKQAVLWESKVLRRIKAAQKTYFINETNGNLKWFNKGGYKCTEQHISNMKKVRWNQDKKTKWSKHISEKNKKVWAARSKEEKQIIGNKISLALKGNTPPNKGIPHSNQTIEKIKKNTKNAMKCEKLRNHLSHKAKQRCDKNFKKRISENNKRKVCCIFCKKELGLSSLGRHQNGTNCKN